MIILSKVMAYLFICGIQSASRLLFIIWNFNEDIQGREMQRVAKHGQRDDFLFFRSNYAPTKQIPDRKL